MIIQIRGTSGSGKTTLVRRTMGRLVELGYARHDEHVPGRKRPLYSTFSREGHTVAVLGHYETECGGGDTISATDTTKAVDVVYNLARDLHDRGCSVLFEGVLLGSEFRRSAALARAVGLDRVLNVALTTSLPECRASVMARRAARGSPKPWSAKTDAHQLGKMRSHASACDRLRAAGVPVVRLDREAAFRTVIERLGLAAPVESAAA